MAIALATAPATQGIHVAGSAFPLAVAPLQKPLLVQRVAGSEELRRHLSTLGFVEGACVRTVADAAGSRIIEVKGARIALEKKVAQKIFVFET